MSDTVRTHRAVCWLNPEQVEFVRALADRVGFEIVAAGSSSLGRSREVAEALSAAGGGGESREEIKPLDDLRGALGHGAAAAGANMVLLADPGDFGAGLESSSAGHSGDENDAQTLADCAAKGCRVFSLEPMPGSLLQFDSPTLVNEGDGLVVLGPAGGASASGQSVAGLAGPGVSNGREWATFCPSLRLSRPVRESAELLAQLGTVHLVVAECWSGIGQGSLGARIFDAIDAVTWLLGQPEQIDAAYVSPGRGKAVHSVPGESLRNLTGDLSANLRFSDGKAGMVVCSNRAGRFSRTLTILGEHGRLRIYDDGFAWIGTDGKTIDSSRESSRIRGSGTGDEAWGQAVVSVSEQLMRALDPAVPSEAPTDYVRVLATAGAALLSARTGECERPTTLLRMARTS